MNLRITSRLHWCRTMALFILVVTGAVHGAELTPHQRAGVETIASSRPCLATALLYVSITPTRSASGSLLFLGIPTTHSVTSLLDRASEDLGSNDILTTWNPYTEDPDSAPAYMVEVQWTLTMLGRGAYVLSTRAQIVDGAGKSIVPAHNIEPLTTVLVTGESYRVVDNAKTL